MIQTQVCSNRILFYVYFISQGNNVPIEIRRVVEKVWNVFERWKIIWYGGKRLSNSAPKEKGVQLIEQTVRLNVVHLNVNDLFMLDNFLASLHENKIIAYLNFAWQLLLVFKCG